MAEGKGVNWGDFTLLIGVMTPVITGRGVHLTVRNL